MRRRLRKKKRIGEFKELGFELTGELRPGISDGDVDRFFERLIDIIELRKLSFGGGSGGDGAFGGFVTRAGPGGANQDDRAALDAFLAGDDAVVRHELSALRDAWYGWD